MAEVKQGRWAAEIEGDFVVLVIGTRIDVRHPVRWFRDVGGMRGMQHMLKELQKHPEKGLLGVLSAGPVLVQYWRSFEALEAFARDPGDVHRPAWQKYWQRVGNDPRSGIFHETYLVRAGEYEAIYANMPPTGLGKAASLVPLASASRARTRLRRTVS